MKKRMIENKCKYILLACPILKRNIIQINFVHSYKIPWACTMKVLEAIDSAEL